MEIRGFAVWPSDCFQYWTLDSMYLPTSQVKKKVGGVRNQFSVSPYRLKSFPAVRCHVIFLFSFFKLVFLEIAKTSLNMFVHLILKSTVLKSRTSVTEACLIFQEVLLYRVFLHSPRIFRRCSTLL